MQRGLHVHGNGIRIQGQECCHAEMTSHRLGAQTPPRLCRGASQYRGVTKHHQHGKWEARIGRVDGSKYLYLGTFESAEEAARAYDRAAVKFRGRKVPGGLRDVGAAGAGWWGCKLIL